MKKIPYVNLAKQTKTEKKEIFSVINKIMDNAQFIGGDEIARFERNICNLLKVKSCVALNSGTDALTLGLHLLGVGKGDSHYSSKFFYCFNRFDRSLRCYSIFSEILNDGNIDPDDIKKITKKTKAIMPVHLSGRVCQMDNILKISKKYKIPIIEDATQSIASKYLNKFSGTFGVIGYAFLHTP